MPIEWTDHQARHEKLNAEYAKKYPQWRDMPQLTLDLVRRETASATNRLVRSGMVPQLEGWTDVSGPSGAEGISFRKFEKQRAEYGFDDIDLVRALLAMIEVVNVSGAEALTIGEGTDRAYQFVAGEMDVRSDWRKMQGQLVNCFIFLQTVLTQAKSVLQRHPFFQQIDVLLAQLQVLVSFVEKSSLQAGSRSSSLQLPDDVAAALGIDANQSTTTDNAYVAKKEIFTRTVLGQWAKYFLQLTVLFTAQLRAAAIDKSYGGIVPTLLDSTDGLQLDMRGVVHPACRNGMMSEGYFPDSGDLHRGKLIKLLLDAKLLAPLEKTSFFVWNRAATLEQVKTTLEKANVSPEATKNIEGLFHMAHYVPFDVRMDGDRNINIVTGTNGSGKTTNIHAIVSQLKLASEARLVRAAEARMSLVDGIYHDFNANRDASAANATSLFMAQVESVSGFLQNGTPHSFGFFDELFNGTNVAYQLALTIAITQEFSRRKLRALISTHLQHLPQIAQARWETELKGIFKLRMMTPERDGTGVPGVRNLHVNNRHEMEPGAVYDSDAFSIAKKKGLPDAVLAQAQSNYELLRGQETIGNTEDGQMTDFVI